MKFRNKLLLNFFIGLQALDVLLTYIAIEIKGLAEHNPLVQFLLQAPEPYLTLILLKVITIIIIYNLIKNKSDKAQTITLTIINVLYVIATTINIVTLTR